MSSGRSSVSRRIAQARTDSCSWSSKTAEERFVGAADHVERPERPELAHRVGVLREDGAERFLVRFERLAAGRPFGQDAAGLADEPLVRVPMQRDELAFREPRQIAGRHAVWAPVRDLVDPARGAVDAVALVALAGVAPVEDEDAAVGAVAQVDAAEPGVGREEDVGLVAADVAAARSLEPLDVHAPAVEVQGEELAPVSSRPLVGQVDRQRRYARGRRRGELSLGAARRPGSASLEWSQCQWSACWSIWA